MCSRLPRPVSIPKVVRDLLWTITSPPILSKDQFPVLPAEFGVKALNLEVVVDWLNALILDPSPLFAFLQDTTSNGRSVALGVYFSTLLEFWLRFCPHLQMEKFDIGKQIVSSTNRTVGQLKFLFRCCIQNGSENCEKQQDFHVESSIKFFLLNPVENSNKETRLLSLEQYVGPHLGENLAWRVQEVNRKLAMRRGESVNEWLTEHYSENVQSHIVLRGYLFEPLSNFHSTSRITVDHDWIFHRNPVKIAQDTTTLKTQLNSSISSDHLRGWWTADLELDLPAKVRANDRAILGDSRFVILPKLHWLSPVVAVEDPYSGQIVLHGDTRFHLQDEEALTLEELIVFVRRHFQKDAIPADSKKSGKVAVPLLVAEIVKCLNDVAENKIIYWNELSRGFIIDPKCWDPSPLSQEPVRYKRTLHQSVQTGYGTREYEVRSTDCDEGFIKPDVVKEVESRHCFIDPASIGPHELCHELVSVFREKSNRSTYADLKRSTRDLFQWRKANSEEAPEFISDRTAYLRACFNCLILAVNDSDEVKQSCRVGYLLLDVFNEFESGNFGISSSQECLEWLTMLQRVASVSDQWEFLNLILRAIDLTITADKVAQWKNSGKNSQFSFIDELVAVQNPRWNSFVVEVVRVFRIGKLLPGHQKLDFTTGDARSVKKIFANFVEQEDWQHAERLVTVVPDLDMIQVLCKRLSMLNMTKALKRLQEIAARSSTISMPTTLAKGISLEQPIDHVRNRSLCTNVCEFKWTYVDTLEKMEEVIRSLKMLEARISDVKVATGNQSIVCNMLVAIDCEWRPQYLTKAQTSYTRDEPRNQFDDDQDDQGCVSIYQLAVGDIVYVVDVQVLGAAAAAPLSYIWRPSSLLMLIGFCVSSDLRRIKNSFPDLLQVLIKNENIDLNPRSPLLALELKHLALSRHIPAQYWGLSKLYSECLGLQLDKEQQCSDWGTRPLSTCQLEYAARDAYAVQRLFKHLIADMSFVGGDNFIGKIVQDLLKRYDVDRNFSCPKTVATTLQPLGKEHVQMALVAHGLEARFFKYERGEQTRVVVKSIAMLVRRGTSMHNFKDITYAVVVLALDRYIDMQALAHLLAVDTKDISLADQETLIRVFGYPRGCLGPIGLREQQTTQVIVDSCLEAENCLLCGAGLADEVYAIAPTELIRTVDAVIAPISTEKYLIRDKIN
ncbi:hypothetical protein CCR75_000376 [Bremia lactucae]|uniref:3'-5' exonuclease domain-containing protein n=1 Tax=Bremia lactucae TaxID=4779 RepID=A0A976FPT4_BRELC|nr:hypothetical protein CCR75_000376 [Bremia lactucae]